VIEFSQFTRALRFSFLTLYTSLRLSIPGLRSLFFLLCAPPSDPHRLPSPPPATQTFPRHLSLRCRRRFFSPLSLYARYPLEAEALPFLSPPAATAWRKRSADQNERNEGCRERIPSVSFPFSPDFACWLNKLVAASPFPPLLTFRGVLRFSSPFVTRKSGWSIFRTFSFVFFEPGRHNFINCESHSPTVKRDLRLNSIVNEKRSYKRFLNMTQQARLRCGPLLSGAGTFVPVSLSFF